MAYEAYRKIIHVDMDAFFASVEQRDRPELRGKPVAVGGSSQRGVVAAASYEARKFGVRSAMASSKAARLCPNLIFVKPRFEVYKAVSNQIREIFLSYTSRVEPLSLDEAYLDVTENMQGHTNATAIAKEIKEKILEQTKLTASAGVSYNKFLAKMASDIHKPNGLAVIKPERADAFIAALDIQKFHGIGRVTAKKMNAMGIFKGSDLRQKELSFLVSVFGKMGHYYFDISRGKDSRTVNADRSRKSIGIENTFENDLKEGKEIEDAFTSLVFGLHKRMLRAGAQGKTVSIKVKFADFEQITRSKTVFSYLSDEVDLKRIAFELLQNEFPFPKGIRLLGVSLSNLQFDVDQEGKQLTLNF